MGIHDFTKVVAVGEFAHNPWPRGAFGGNDKVGQPGEDFAKGGTVVETGVQQKQVALLEVLYELSNEFVFRGAHLAVNKAQGRPADHIKQAAKLQGNRSQSLAALVCAETLEERWRFG